MVASPNGKQAGTGTDKNQLYTSNRLWEGFGKPDLGKGMLIVLAAILAVCIVVVTATGLFAG